MFATINRAAMRNWKETGTPTPPLGGCDAGLRGPIYPRRAGIRYNKRIFQPVKRASKPDRFSSEG